jgi:hypothetical protein
MKVVTWVIAWDAAILNWLFGKETGVGGWGGISCMPGGKGGRANRGGLAWERLFGDV